MSIGLKIPVFSALDVDTKEEALAIAKATYKYVGGYKVGPRLCMRYGQDLVKELAELAPVFVDNKYYDIPNTMESSVRATFNAGASFCTIHAGSGREALKRIFNLEQELNQKRPFRVLCVTVLTSFNQQGIPANWVSDSLEDQVKKLAEESQSVGLKGLVCSPLEVTKMRDLYPEAYLVTPGIRLKSVANDDQKRVMTPKEALAAGASSLVIGRPIYKAEDSVQAAKEIAQSIQK